MLRQPRAGAVEHRRRQDQPVGRPPPPRRRRARRTPPARPGRAGSPGVRTGRPSASARGLRPGSGAAAARGPPGAAAGCRRRRSHGRRRPARRAPAPRSPGVPMKISRIGASGAGSGPRLLPLQLLHAGGDHRALHRAEIVDEQPALQVVDLVLGADRPAVGELVLVASPVEARASAAAPAPAGSRPRRRPGSTGSPPRSVTVSSEVQSDLGVDQHHRLRRLVLAGAVHDEDLLHHPELGRGEPDARAPRTWSPACPSASARTPVVDRRRRGAAALRRRGSGWIRMGRIAMAAR